MATLILTTILLYLIGLELADRRANKQATRKKIRQYFVNVKSGDSFWLI